MRISDAGDAALVLELEPVIDVNVNARVIAVARAISARHISGVRDVIPTYRSVAVHFDPLVADAAVIARVMSESAACSPTNASGTLIEVPVSYGGEYGPDLREIAEWSQVSEAHVIDQHAALEYRVFMLGFLPGFAYMGLVDESIAMPRRATPRLRVPAGSVGIAGRQTGIYPRQSPGGWQLIGRTALQAFDAAREPASLFAPGDRVKFVADSVVRGGGPSGPPLWRRGGGPLGPPGRSITVVRPGLSTTIQDLGRWGHQHLGVPVSGPMDIVSHRLANALVGNPREAATLEATVLGPEIRFEQETVVAVTGGDLVATLDGAPLPLNMPRACEAGAVVRFGVRRSGARAYIACDGGVAVPAVLGSRATHVLSGLGGLDGRALAAGDRVPLGQPRDHPVSRRAESPRRERGARLRVIPGPQDDAFDEAAFETLQGARFTISPQSDRMGYRLSGARVGSSAGNAISDAAFAGGVQIPPSGEPILLMADHQTTGGYPQMATVITADLPAAGQLAPGDWIEFEVCTRREAIAALLEQESLLRDVG